MLRRLLINIVSPFKKTPVVGTPDVKPDETVDVNRLGDTVSGKYHVDEVSHTFGEDDYQEKFDAERNDTGDK